MQFGLTSSYALENLSQHRLISYAKSNFSKKFED